MAPSWEDYRRRRRLFLIAWLGYLPGMGAIAILLERIFHNEVIIMAVALCWMVFFAVSGSRLISFRCPNCRKRFFRSWYSNAFARKCMHCGWPKWMPAPLPFEARQP